VGLDSRASAIVLSAATWLLAVPIAGQAAGGPAPIASLSAVTGVSELHDVAAWSAYEPATKLWHVALREDGRTSTLPAPATHSTIEVAVGPGTGGAPAIVYSACPERCELTVASLNGDDSEPVPGTSGASHPAIWGSRVAWVSGRDRVWSSLVSGRGRIRLGGAPRRKCYETLTGRSRLICVAPEEPTVEAVALDGGQLALIDSFRLIDDGIGASGTTTEVRTEPDTGGPQRLVAILTVGEGDESWVGPSWLGGDLYFYEDSSGGDDEQIGTYRYDPARGSYAYAHAGAYLTGFAMTDSRRALEATAPGNPRSGITCEGSGERYEGGRCTVQLSPPLRFEPVKSHALVFTP
jgi:hypothetical protein